MLPKGTEPTVKKNGNAISPPLSNKPTAIAFALARGFAYTSSTIPRSPVKPAISSRFCVVIPSNAPPRFEPNINSKAMKAIPATPTTPAMIRCGGAGSNSCGSGASAYRIVEIPATSRAIDNGTR